MARQSILTLALLHQFVYEFRGNKTYIILDRRALIQPTVVHTDREAGVIVGGVELVPMNSEDLNISSFATLT